MIPDKWNHGGPIAVNTTVVHHAVMSREDSQFKLRLPAALREQIELAAQQSKRSLNAEIVARLENTVALDREVGERTEREMDHSTILGWVAHVEGLNARLHEDLAELRRNPVVLDGAALAKEVSKAISAPDTRSLIAFLALQAAYPGLVTDAHRQRVAIVAARLGGVSGTDPKEILSALAIRMISEVLEQDLGL